MSVHFDLMWNLDSLGFPTISPQVWVSLLDPWTFDSDTTIRSFERGSLGL